MDLWISGTDSVRSIVAGDIGELGLLKLLAADTPRRVCDLLLVAAESLFDRRREDFELECFKGGDEGDVGADAAFHNVVVVRFVRFIMTDALRKLGFVLVTI